jgi:hypothetical protein
LLASVAWAGWIFLHTAADPTRDARIAHAVLDDAAARGELAADIANSIAQATRSGSPVAVDGNDPKLRAAVTAVLADPAIADNVVNAIAAGHEEALGVTPSHPAVIDTSALLAAVRAQLVPVDPALARALPAVTAKQIKLPTGKLPYVRQLRDLARRWVGVLAAAAAVLIGLAFAGGGHGRMRVLRRAGVWGVGAGLTWVILPPLLSAAARRWWTSQAAIVRAVVHGATAQVTATAVVLVVAGATGIVTSVALPRMARLAKGRGGRGGDAGGPVAVRPGNGPGEGFTRAGPAHARGPGSGWQPLGGEQDSWTRSGDVPAPTSYDERGRPAP